ncbi:MAG: MBL fold metallo-hydrolase [Myxococcales bacterium]|nr:MBL fold metallo-hydrolase [Myxococcales bacterium]USN49910.1 MAG: MBL fold metallo-hydrolase [Myxococcales bacterium]
MKLSFHGADRSVTGSCHLIECGSKRILIDCGLYQGSKELDQENSTPLGFDPATIDFLLLTHAHLDHCGRIPLLVKQGFKGEIIATWASKELARIVLLDAAHLHEEDAYYRNKKANSRGESADAVPLYTTLDALNSLEYFGRHAHFNEALALADGIKAFFLDAGHILGAASILLELKEKEKKRRILFSGDIGNKDRPLLKNPQTAQVDIVVMESTYGNRNHKCLDDSIDDLYKIVSDTFKRGGNVIIPTFALERAQELLYFLREGLETKKLAVHPKVFLDSPMAISATQIFEHHPECFNQKIKQLFHQGIDPFLLPDLNFTRETADSIAINEIKNGAIIMAGSGMCTGGRIRHHLRNNIARKECSILFVGYAAIGTLARYIIDGHKSVKLFGDELSIEAQIHTISGFSAHADQEELINWHRSTSAKKTFLVHGDEDAMKELALKLNSTTLEMPKLGEVFDL